MQCCRAGLKERFGAIIAPKLFKVEEASKLFKHKILLLFMQKIAKYLLNIITKKLTNFIQKFKIFV